MATIPLYVYIIFCLSIHLMGPFHLLALVNNAAVTFMHKYLSEFLFPFLFFFKIFRNLCTPCEARTHNPEIERCMLNRLSQPDALVFISLGYAPRSGIAGSYGNCVQPFD